MDYAPKIIKGDAKDAFDLVYEPIIFELSFEDELLFAKQGEI